MKQPISLMGSAFFNSLSALLCAFFCFYIIQLNVQANSSVHFSQIGAGLTLIFAIGIDTTKEII